MYVGRFAPTTSGPLHLRSLLAALASYLDARAHGGQWLLRLDDIDEPRSSNDAAELALATLKAHAMHWDGVITRQTSNRQRYLDAIDQLHERELTFFCTCSRSKLRGAEAYPGYCRHRRTRPEEPAAIRVRVPDSTLTFHDRIQSETSGRLTELGGDFIVMRKEHIAAYPLAVVIDDDVTGVTHVVRGADLLENTFAQLFLIRELGLALPTYAHIPILNQRDEIKLSKRDQARMIDNSTPGLNLISSLHMLGMEPPPGLTEPAALLEWGVEHWDMANVPKQRSVTDFISI